MCSRCYWFRYMACSRVFLRHTLMEMNWSYAARRLMILAMWSSEVWGVQDFCALGFCLTKGWYVPAWSYWYQGWSYSIISGLVLFVLSHPLFWCLFASLLRLPGHCFFFFFVPFASFKAVEHIMDDWVYDANWDVLQIVIWDLWYGCSELDYCWMIACTLFGSMAFITDWLWIIVRLNPAK